MQIAHEYLPTNYATIRPNDKIWMTTSQIEKKYESRIASLTINTTVAVSVQYPLLK
jgi:hypothetical protein